MAYDSRRKRASDWGFVPEKNRVRIAGVTQNFEKRMAVLSASQEVDGKVIIHKTTINW